MAKKPARISQELIAQKLGLERSSISKALGMGRRSDISPKTIQRIFKTAKKLGYDFSRMTKVRRREFNRRPANLKAKIKVCLKNDDLFDSGHAIIKNISPNGAFLRQVDLSKRALPIDPFTIELTILQGRLKGVQARGKLVRFGQDMGMGVRFLEVNEASSRRLAQSVG